MGWERKRGKLHELNQLLRGSTNTTFIPVAGRAAANNSRRALRHHARRRHAPAARRCRRLVGTMAHPLNRPQIQRRRRAAWWKATASCSRASLLRCPPIARARSSKESFPVPAESIPIRRPFPTFIRILFHEGSYTGKGHLRPRCFRSGAGRQSAGKHPAEPRSVRRHIRARRAGHRYRAVRRISLALRSRRGPPAPLGARRLATAALDFRARRTREQTAATFQIPAIGRWKMLDNLRRTLSAPCHVSDPAGRLAAAARSRRGCGRDSSSPRSRFPR